MSFAIWSLRLTPILDRYAAVGAALLYFVAVFFFYPFCDVFEIDPDEGINAIKALMVHRGYSLYREVWSDQPPLFTHLLRQWFLLWGWEVHIGRVLVLVFASLIVFATYDLVRMTWGHRAAVFGAVFLPCSAHFVPLSVSIMVGLPSVSFAVLCVWAVVRWARRDRRLWLVVAGLLFGFSLLTKLMTAFLFPVLAVWVGLLARLGRGSRSRTAWWKRPAIWALSVIVTGAVLLRLLGAPDFSQLVLPHLEAGKAAMLERYGIGGLVKSVYEDWALAALAVLGTLLIIRRRCWELLIIPLWAGTALAALSVHRPFWYHYNLLLTVVACPAAGLAVAEIFARGWRSDWQRRAMGRLAMRLAAVATTVALAVSLVRGAKFEPRDTVNPTPSAKQAVDAMTRFRELRTVVFADDPMYAFRAGHEVPPQLAVVSLKRIATGNLTVEEILEALKEQPPTQVVLSHGFPPAISEQIVAAIADRYRVVFADRVTNRVRVYVRRDVIAEDEVEAPVS